MARACKTLGLLLALAFAGCGGGAERSDVLLVTIDTLRADRVGCYGHEGAHTPALDGLAARGIRYAQCQAPGPVTLPSHATILSGQLPPGHGVRNNGSYALPDGVPTLATVLRGEGYRTGAFVAALPLERRFGLARGFDHYDDALPGEAGLAFHFRERPAAQVVERALAWLRAQPGDQPAFVWVHFFEPHAPYTPPGRWARQLPGEPYDGEVAAADDALGELLRGFAAARGAEPLVVATSDHGEGLGDHGEATHALFLYQSTLHVPLLLAGPGLPAGVVVDEPVMLADVAPTLLAALGLDPAGSLPAADGIDLAPGAGTPPPRRPLYSETVYPWEGYRWSPGFALREGPQKVILSARPRGFDLEADPGELQPRDPQDAPWIEASLDRLRGLARSLERAPAATRQPSAQEREALAALGYTGGSGATDGGGRQLLEAVGEAPDPLDRRGAFTRLSAAEEQLRAGEPGAALGELSGLLAGDPDNVWGHVLTAHAHALRREWQAALDAADRADRLRPGWLEVVGVQARMLAELGRVDDALARFAQARELEPHAREWWVEPAGLLQRHGRPGEARALLEAGLEALPATARGPLHGALARLDLQAGRLEEGQVHLRSARAAAPRDESLWLLEALYLRGQQRWAGLVEHLEAEPAWLGASGEAQMQLGTARWRGGDARGGVQAFRRAAALDPQSALAHNNAAWVLGTELDAAAEAEPLAREALRLDPGNLEFHDTLVELLERQGRLDEARRHLGSLPDGWRDHPGLAARAARLRM